MSDWSRRLREAERDQRREERAALKQQREIAKLLREQKKLDEQQRAKLEVEEYEARIAVLLSLHRDSTVMWDWIKLAATLAPLPPSSTKTNESRLMRNLLAQPEATDIERERALLCARDEDAKVLALAEEAYREATSDWKKLTTLANRILTGDTAAYRDAMEEFSPLEELADLGSSVDFTMTSATTIECVITMNGTQVIPAETKTLTTTGKLSIKAMPRQQFHEIYQDYICGGVLRVAREAFALLPIRCIIITAVAPLSDNKEAPVLSVVINRSDLSLVNFARADASDTLDRLPHRGDFKASRKSGAFQPIRPFALNEVVPNDPSSTQLDSVRVRFASERAAVSELLRSIKDIDSS